MVDERDIPLSIVVTGAEAIPWIFQKRLLRENTPRNDTYERVYYNKLS